MSGVVGWERGTRGVVVQVQEGCYGEGMQCTSCRRGEDTAEERSRKSNWRLRRRFHDFIACLVVGWGLKAWKEQPPIIT